MCSCGNVLVDAALSLGSLAALSEIDVIQNIVHIERAAIITPKEAASIVKQ